MVLSIESLCQAYAATWVQSDAGAIASWRDILRGSSGMNRHYGDDNEMIKSVRRQYIINLPSRVMAAHYYHQ